MKNWLLTTVTLFLLYVILEVFCLDIFFRYLSHGAYPYLDEGVSFILQPTKKSLTPKNYIALAGDSYAMGLGDEYYVGSSQARAEYGVAPFLHKALDQDVVSFGTAGNSSISGMVTQPLLAMKFFKKSWRIDIDPPQKMYLLFYEGNDFSDNVEYPHYTRKRVKFQHEKMEDGEYFSSYIQEAAIDTFPWNKKIEEMHWYDELYLAKFIWKFSCAIFNHREAVVQEIKKRLIESGPKKIEPIQMPGRFGWKSPGFINQINLMDQQFQIPDQIQGPSSLDLTDDEKELSLISFQESLRMMKKLFPKTEITVVYMPSVLTCYEITSSKVSVQHFRKSDAVLHSVSEAILQSNWGAEQIRLLTASQQVNFIDARPHLREAAKNQLLHGPYN